MPRIKISDELNDMKPEVQDRVPDGNGKRDGENTDEMAQEREINMQPSLWFRFAGDRPVVMN
jgi:hypothetical protein